MQLSVFMFVIFTVHKQSLKQGIVLSSICQGFCPQGGGMHGRGVCMAGGGVWQGACMAGGMHGGGVHGRGVMHGRGVCMAGGMHGRGHAW